MHRFGVRSQSRSLHLANGPSFSARSSAQPISRPLDWRPSSAGFRISSSRNKRKSTRGRAVRSIWRFPAKCAPPSASLNRRTQCPIRKDTVGICNGWGGAAGVCGKYKDRTAPCRPRGVIFSPGSKIMNPVRIRIRDINRISNLVRILIFHEYQIFPEIYRELSRN